MELETIAHKGMVDDRIDLIRRRTLYCRRIEYVGQQPRAEHRHESAVTY